MNSLVTARTVGLGNWQGGTRKQGAKLDTGAFPKGNSGFHLLDLSQAHARTHTHACSTHAPTHLARRQAAAEGQWAGVGGAARQPGITQLLPPGLSRPRCAGAGTHSRVCARAAAKSAADAAADAACGTACGTAKHLLRADEHALGVCRGGEEGGRRRSEGPLLLADKRALRTCRQAAQEEGGRVPLWCSGSEDLLRADEPCMRTLSRAISPACHLFYY